MSKAEQHTASQKFAILQEVEVIFALKLQQKNSVFRKSIGSVPGFLPASVRMVRKYESGGQDALWDGRRRRKAPEELTEAERHKFAMKKMEYENERLRAENAFLKKLQVFERRRL